MTSKAHELFSSLRLTAALLAALALLSIPGTLLERSGVVLAPVYAALVVALCVNVAVCVFSRRRGIRLSALVMHVGIILLIAAGFFSMTRRVMTVNIHVGDSVSTVYDWSAERETTLDHEIRIVSMDNRHYPSRVKVGVLSGGEKAGLFEIETGRSFESGGYRVMASSIDPLAVTLNLEVYRGDTLVEKIQVPRTGDAPLPGTPLSFRLVAYQTPRLKSASVNIEIVSGGKVAASGSSGVNKPFSWGGRGYYHTNTAVDEFGNPYAGIQVVEDRWKPLVYIALVALACGVSLRFAEVLMGRKL
ncbi:MAG: hypothetical protein HZA20_10645 [Nitrospirae bacterium]|nr:hypothetical protein [Nitrospirota bacterium]